MNVAINARLLHSNHIEGIGRFIYETTCAMATQNPADRFYLFFDRKIQNTLPFPENIIKIIVPLPTRHPILWHIWFEYLLPYYFRKHKIDVFVAGDGYMSLKTTVPTILVTHDLAYLHYPDHITWLALQHYRFYIPRYHQKAAHIISVSEYVRQDIITNMKVPADKVRVAYNALNPPTDLGLDNHRFSADLKEDYFVYVGSLHPRKNIINLIDGFEKFNAANQDQYQLVLAGRIAWKADQISKKIKTSKNVIYVGMVSEAEKYTLLQHSIALIYISLFEGFGIPLLEAMYAQTAVITSDCTSMPEVGGKAALYVDPKDINSIAVTIQQLVDDPNLRPNLIKMGSSRLKDFTWTRSADIIYEKINTILYKTKHT